MLRLTHLVLTGLSVLSLSFSINAQAQQEVRCEIPDPATLLYTSLDLTALKASGERNLFDACKSLLPAFWLMAESFDLKLAQQGEINVEDESLLHSQTMEFADEHGVVTECTITPLVGTIAELPAAIRDFEINEDVQNMTDEEVTVLMVKKIKELKSAIDQVVKISCGLAI